MKQLFRIILTTSHSNSNHVTLQTAWRLFTILVRVQRHTLMVSLDMSESLAKQKIKIPCRTEICLAEIFK